MTLITDLLRDLADFSPEFCVKSGSILQGGWVCFFHKATRKYKLDNTSDSNEPFLRTFKINHLNILSCLVLISSRGYKTACYQTLRIIILPEFENLGLFIFLLLDTGTLNFIFYRIFFLGIPQCVIIYWPKMMYITSLESLDMFLFSVCYSRAWEYFLCMFGPLKIFLLS